MSTTSDSWTAIFELAVALAHEAGEELRQRFGKPRTVVLKGDLDPVTDADHAAETVIRQGIQTRYPDHSIQGEEQGTTVASGAVEWIVDPLDGTVNYAHGFPQFAVSIAVADASGMQVGVVYDPLRDECFTARRGQAAYLNDELIRVSETTELQRSLLATGFPYDRHLKDDNNHREFAAMNLVTQGRAACGCGCPRFGLRRLWPSRWVLGAGSLPVGCGRRCSARGAGWWPAIDLQRCLL